MALSLNKSKLDNLASDIWKSAERLRGKFKSYEYRSFPPRTKPQRAWSHLGSVTVADHSARHDKSD